MAFTFFDDGKVEPYVDVLIVGSGPAGLMSATLLSRHGVNFRIIDKKPTRARAGRADYIQSRTLEVLESIGLHRDLSRKSCKIREYTFWSRDAGGSLNRTNVGPDVISPTPFPWSLSVDKGDLVDTFSENLESGNNKVERYMELLMFTRPAVGQRITVHIRNHNTGAIETWYTSYILGCDGIESLVRETAGIDIDTHGNLDFWVVADVSASTDLPDYRRRCTIRSPQGNCVLTPRKNSEFRIRTLLSSEDLSSPQWSMTNVTQQISPISHVASSMGLANAIQTRISAALAPHTFLIKEISWIEQYTSRKTLAKKFADDTLSVFLLGSACHTHSPLTKQTTNAGLMDAWNLAWKLALVVVQGAPRSILSSYEAERRALLAKAVEFDCKVDHVFSIRGDNAEAFMGFYDFEEASGYTSGCGARYPPGILVKEEKRVYLRNAKDTLTPGKRLFPGRLVRHLDGNDVDISHVLHLSGRFTLIYFAADTLSMPIFFGLSNLLTSFDSPTRVGTGTISEHGQRLVDIVLIHTADHFSVSIPRLSQPWPLHPMSIFEDPGGHYHTTVGLSPKLGGLCLVRPDGYIAIVSNLDDGLSVTRYLNQFVLQDVDSDEFARLTGPNQMNMQTD